MISVTTNRLALFSALQNRTSTAKFDAVVQELSSGNRVNSAADDAAGIAVAGKLDKNCTGYQKSIANAADFVSALNIASEGLQTIESIVQRLKELAVQSSNGTYVQTDRQNLELEKEQLLQQITLICSKTLFNNKALLEGTFNEVAQVGADPAESFNISLLGACTDELGSGLSAFTSASETNTTSSLIISAATNNSSPSNVEFYTNVGSQQISYTNATVSPSSGTANMPTVDVVFEKFVSENPGGSYSISNFSGSGSLTLGSDLTFDTNTGKFTLVKNLLTSSDVGAYTMKVNYSSGGQNFTQNLTFNLDKVNHRKDQLSNNTNYVVTSSIDLEMALGGEDLVVDLKNSEDFVYFGAFTDLHHTLTYDGGTYYSAGYQLTNLQKDGSSVAAGFAIDDGVLTGTVTDLEAGVYTFDVEASSGSTDTHRFTQSFTVLVTGALALSDADFSTQSSAKTALALTESAVADISRRLAKVGSYINRLETILRKNSQAVIKTKQSVGRIVDTDFSRSTIILAKQDILKKSSAEMIRLATSEKKRTLMLL